MMSTQSEEATHLFVNGNPSKDPTVVLKSFVTYTYKKKSNKSRIDAEMTALKYDKNEYDKKKRG